MNANGYFKVKSWVWGLIFLISATLTIASEQPVRQVNDPETREVLEIQATNRTLLRELGTRFAAADNADDAALVAAQIRQAKEGLEMRTVEVRLKYARNAGDQQRVTLLEGMLKLLQDPEPTTSPGPVKPESPTTGEG